MEMKQINESTLKITISLEDLEERGMELRDFLVPQEKTEEFFYSVMDELELPDNFKQSGMLSFRVTPKKDRLDVFVTKTDLSEDLNLEDLADLGDVSQMSPEEFFKTLEKSMMEKGDVTANQFLEDVEKDEEESGDSEEELRMDYTHYVLEFPTFDAVMALVMSLDFPTEASELYKLGSSYYMTVLVSLENQPSYYANLVYSRLLEHAHRAEKTRAYLQEHALLLVGDDILSLLKQVEVS